MFRDIKSRATLQTWICWGRWWWVPWHQKPGYPSNFINCDLPVIPMSVPWHQKPGYPSNKLQLRWTEYVPWHQKPGYPSNFTNSVMAENSRSSVTSKAGLPFKRNKRICHRTKRQFRDIKSRATLQTLFNRWSVISRSSVTSKAGLPFKQLFLGQLSFKSVPWHQKPGYPSNINSSHRNKLNKFRDIKSRATLQTNWNFINFSIKFRDIKSRATLQTATLKLSYVIYI